MKQSRVRVTREGWWIDGQRRILLCASLFYFRVPREEWADRIERAAQAGYHALDVYIPWNYHEPERGLLLFEGERDVRRFFRLVRDAGLYVIARPGPYICSEWDGGALPAWLYPDLSQPETDPRRQTTFHSGHKTLRQADERFLAEVSRWYDTILPMIREEQVDAGGAVLAVQIDNELDFYPCDDPRAYLSFLKDSVIRHGITVPILACSGEDGVSKATGDLEGVVPTANIYSRYRAPGLEERARRVREQLLARGAPLTITETDRNHFTLRRLLSAGAHFLGPYLQVSGHHTGYFAGQNNWGKPSTFLQNDYDFGGMIGPDGELREEYYEARILSGMIAALEPELVDAEPKNVPVDAIVQASDTTAAKAPGEIQRVIASALVAPSGARLLFLPNLYDEPLEVVEPVRTTVPPHRTAIVAGDVSLARFGVPVTIKTTDAEIARVVSNPEGCVVVLACDPPREHGQKHRQKLEPTHELIMTVDRVTGNEAAGGSGTKAAATVSLVRGSLDISETQPNTWRLAPGPDELSVAVVHTGDARLVLVFAARELAARAWEISSVLEMGWDWVSRDGAKTLLHKRRPVYRIMADGSVTELDEERIQGQLTPLSLPAKPCEGYRLVVEKPVPAGLLTHMPPDRSWQGGPRYLESLGVHYGAAYYRFTVEIPAAGAAPGLSEHDGPKSVPTGPGLWIGGASDAVSFYLNGSYLGTALPRGRSVWLVGPLPWREGENEVMIRTEIMGHSNFHDVTLPVTHLGSMRGLAPPVVLSDRSPDARDYQEHLQSAYLPSRDAGFIYGAPQPAGRIVDASWQLWRAALIEDETLGASDSLRAFPLRLEAGAFAELQVDVPDLAGDLPVWVKVQGRGIKGELWLSGRLVGRFWLGDHPDLLFTGGRWLDRIWIPRAWLDQGSLTVRLLSVDRQGGILEGLEWLRASGGKDFMVQ